MHRVRAVVQRVNLTSTTSDASVLEAARTMAEGRVGAIPVIDGEALVGMFSERDLMVRVVVAGRDPGTTRVSEVMTREVKTAAPEETVATCLEKMREAGCRHLPVVLDGRVMAVISMRDLLRDELEEQDDEIRNLRAYLHQTPIS